MPSSIPYDPSLVLAAVVSEKALEIVTGIAGIQGPVDAAQDELNSWITSKRSLDFTKNEISNLGIDTTNIEKEMENVNKSVEAAAVGYAKAKVSAEPQIAKLRSQIRMVHAEIESPIDYTKSDLKTLPLAADSMSMDVQYFNRDTNFQGSDTHASAVSSYVGAKTSVLGAGFSSQMAASAENQVSDQVSNHNIVGTLVFSVVCTHKNAQVFAPFILNVDKAIQVWNGLFPDAKLDPTKADEMIKVAMSSESDPKEKKFSIISGVTFGSSFVGMVHILNSTNTTVGERLASQAASLSASMQWGSWFAQESGEFGVNSTFGDDVKNLLSSQNITSHVTVISMGVIPSIVANDVDNAVQKWTSFDPAANMAAVATIQNATVADQSSVSQQAAAARTGQQSNEIQASKITAALGGLSDISTAKNKVIDMNSMMTALQDYLTKAAGGQAGVPINYYLKNITVRMLAEMWAAKYYPGKYMAITYDDSTPAAGPAAPAAGGSSGAAAAPAASS